MSIFIDEKQYSGLLDYKGLVVPSHTIVDAFKILEMMFKQVVPCVVHTEKLRTKVMGRAIHLIILNPVHNVMNGRKKLLKSFYNCACPSCIKRAKQKISNYWAKEK